MKVWINEASTIMVRMFDNGLVQIAFRSEPDAVWGPPETLKVAP